MAAPVEDDSRGILRPAAGLERFRLTRHSPSAEVVRFVDRYWVVAWDLTDQPPYHQQVFAHPVVNVVFEAHATTVYGMTTRLTTRTLEGAGQVLGVMFRPGGFRPFVQRPLSQYVDAVIDIAGVFGATGRHVHDAVAASDDELERVGLVDDFLASRVPVAAHRCETVSALVESIAGDPTVVRVDTIAAREGLSVRQLQRLFADYVGLSPKAIIRRYRLYEAAERVSRGAPVDWARLAVELGYSDQAHLTRDFSAALGMPPERYARTVRADA